MIASIFLGFPGLNNTLEGWIATVYSQLSRL